MFFHLVLHPIIYIKNVEGIHFRNTANTCRKHSCLKKCEKSKFYTNAYFGQVLDIRVKFENVILNFSEDRGGICIVVVVFGLVDLSKILFFFYIKQKHQNL
jgi:hypothetical protein